MPDHNYPFDGILKVRDGQVVDKRGTAFIFRGVGLGGWMNMENFVSGFPGHEQPMRKAMLKSMGKEKYEYFFDRFLHWFFTEDDAKLLKSLGLNCVRLPFNYRHFEDDMKPKVLKSEGFKHLDRVIDLCAKEGIFSILDMHTLPGGQSGGWHSDNVTTHAGFWDHKDFQDRTIWLWEEIAKRYKDNPWVAGYNPINEPADPEHYRLPQFYERLEKAIRAIDPDHILWLDGNTYASEWQEFENAIPNAIYSIHDYSTMGFPTGERYKGTDEQKETLRKQYMRKCEFQHQNNLMIWNGEFGPVYASPSDPEANIVNQERYNLLGEQLNIYDEHQIPWHIWLYKDIGLQGMVCTSPESSYNTLIAPIVEKKRRLQLDQWGKHPSEEVAAVIEPLLNWIDEVAPQARSTYPKIWGTRRHVEANVLQSFLANSFVDEFAALFANKSKDELEELAKCWALENCVKREGLNEMLKKHASMRSSGG